MRLKTVFTILHETRYVKSVLRRYCDSLARGKYYQHDCFRALSLQDADTLDRSRKYFDVQPSSGHMARVARCLNKMGYYRNRKKSSTAEYQAFYISNNYDKKREVKLFSFTSGKILTICTDSAVMEKQISEYGSFGKAYPMPRVVKSDKYENSFEIAMIDRENVKSDAAALSHIARITMAYNEAPQRLAKITVADLLNVSCEDAQMQAYMGQIRAMIAPCLLDAQFALCLQHGDLSKDNLMYGTCEGKTDFWWIDWEHARDRIFCYDFFFYILHSAFYGDMGPFRAYLGGEVDDTLAAYFSHFGLAFQVENKIDYLLVYAVPFLADRVCAKGHGAVLQKYVELLASMAREARGDEA